MPEIEKKWKNVTSKERERGANALKTNLTTNRKITNTKVVKKTSVGNSFIEITKYSFMIYYDTVNV